MPAICLPWLIMLMVQSQPENARTENGAGLRQQLRMLEDSEQAQWEKLAETLEKSGKTEAATETRKQISPPYSTNAPELFLPLPEIVQAMDDQEFELSDEARAIRDQTAKKLLELAKKSVIPGVDRFSFADHCLREILRRDPNHPEARRLLGYVSNQGGWATPFALEQLKAGMKRHPLYGWVPASWFEELDRGNLPGTVINREVPEQWLPAAKANELRSDILARPWMITTPHFKIRTNVPLAEAITFERRLEAFHGMFFSLLGDVIGRERLPLAQRFSNTKPASSAVPRRYEVWFFADRTGYINYFKRTFQKDEQISLGYFMPPSEARMFKTNSRSYFFQDPNAAIDTESTLFHEVSHQLLFETAGASRFERNPGNHWVWEGLGSYFETVRVDSETLEISVGEPSGPRMAQARLRLVDRGERIPLQDFVAMDRARFEATPGIYLNYAQAMALTLFLMHSEQGKYRDGFQNYVRSAYDGRLKGAHSLEQYLLTTFEELDTEFARFLKTLPANGL